MCTKRRAWNQLATLFLLAVMLAISLALHSSTLLAQTIPESAAGAAPVEESDPVFAAYAEAMKIPYEEAERRLLLQAAMNNVEIKIAEAEPTYAGSWTQHEPTFGLVVALTDPNGQTIVEEYLQDIAWADLVQVVQRPRTLVELEGMLDQTQTALRGVEGLSDLIYATSLNIQESKVRLHSPVPDVLQDKLVQEQVLQGLPIMLEDIEIVLQEQPAAPAQWKCPYLLGGTPTSSCTAGFVVKRHSDNRRFISTAGHCPNWQSALYAYPNGTGIYLGPVELENDPLIPVGPRGREADFQVHRSSVRDFDLTNRIRTDATTTGRVVSYEYKASSLNDWVCKHGKMTGLSCGWVWSITYNSYGSTGGSYVQVYNPLWAVGQIGCQGDSGSPVFRSLGNGDVSGLGNLSGVMPPPECGSGYNNWFIYSPVDEIEALGYSILTTDYSEYYYQNVFWSESSCTEYKAKLNENGDQIPSSRTERPCQTFAPNNGGAIQSYTLYALAGQLREAIWRNNTGYTRNTPLNADGTVNWGAAPTWAWQGSGSGPQAQDDFILGNDHYQNVFWTESNCVQYKTPLDDNGNRISAQQTPSTCRTSVPSTGAVQSYTAYVVGDYLRESIWQGNVGYVRNVPLNATKTDVLWSSAPAWSQCCTGTAPRAQSVFILNHP